MKKKLFYIFASLAVCQPLMAVTHAQLLERIVALEKRLESQEVLKAEIRNLKDEISELKEGQEKVLEAQEEVLEATENIPDEDDFVKSKNGGMEFGGYVDMEFHHRDSKSVSSPSKFDQHRFIFDVQGNISEKVSFVAELEYEHSADSVGMEQAFIDYSFDENNAFRFGSILVPMGRVNYLHDSPLRDFTERPKVSRILMPSTWFDSGAGLVGEFGSGDGRFEYEVYAMNGLQDDGYRLAAEQVLAVFVKKGKSGTEHNNNKAFTGRLGYSFDDTNMGVSFYKADVGAYTVPVGGTNNLLGERDLEMWAFDVEHQLTHRLEWIGEYMQGDVAGNFASAVAPTASAPNNAGYDMAGWYSQLNYVLDKRERYGAHFRWGRTDTAKGYTNAGDITERVFGFTFRPNDGTVFKLEYHWEDELSATGTKLNNDGLVFGLASYF